MMTSALVVAIAVGTNSWLVSRSFSLFRRAVAAMIAAAITVLSVWWGLYWLPACLLLVLTLWNWRRHTETLSQLIICGLIITTVILSFWLMALPYVWLLLATGAIRLWQSQRHWPLRLLGTAWMLVLALLVSFLSSWPQVILTLAIALLLLFMTELISFFFTQQDTVFAIGLDQMMAQYSQEVQDLYANMRGWRHDYHDHLQALKAYLDDQRVAEARRYLDSLEERLDTVDTLIHSGNVLLDAIMNAKLTLAEHAHIPTNAKVFVGTRPLIKDLDLVVIVGNLMDNALEAIEEQPDGEMRRLRVYIAILKQQLYISVTNSRPRDQVIDFRYASTKNDKRGLGIRRINKLVSKYGGMINRQYEEEVFVTEIAIPLAQSK